MTKRQARIGPHSQSVSFDRLDGRGVVARAISAITKSLTDHLGGEGQVTAPQRLLINMIAKKCVRFELLAAELNDKRGSFEDDRRFIWFGNSIRHDLRTLGLEAFKPDDDDLDALVERAARDGDDSDGEIVARPARKASKPARSNTVKKRVRRARVKASAARSEDARGSRTV